MLKNLKSWYDGFRGSGDYAITVPPMDGALRPNNAIEEANRLVDWKTPDNVVVGGLTVWFSSKNDLICIEANKVPKIKASYDSPISALSEKDGALSVALTSGEITIIGGQYDKRHFKFSSQLPRSNAGCLVGLIADCLVGRCCCVSSGKSAFANCRLFFQA